MPSLAKKSLPPGSVMSSSTHSKSSLGTCRYPKRHRDCVQDVDVIDIEDEDHSFAAFFIGMKAGENDNNVKRPLVGFQKNFTNPDCYFLI